MIYITRLRIPSYTTSTLVIIQLHAGFIVNCYFSCIYSFVSRNLSSTPESNMAIMEVNLPSGFTADIDSLPSLGASQSIKLVETKNEDTTVVMYFDNFTRDEYCPTVSAFRTHAVANQRPVAVLLYDYYDTCKYNIIFMKLE